MTGASGLLGSALIPALEADGHEVLRGADDVQRAAREGDPEAVLRLPVPRPGGLDVPERDDAPEVPALAQDDPAPEDLMLREERAQTDDEQVRDEERGDDPDPTRGGHGLQGEDQEGKGEDRQEADRTDVEEHPAVREGLPVHGRADSGGLR